MHSAEALRERYANGSSTPGEVNAIARIYASIKKLNFPQALEEVHDGLGYGMAEDIDCSQGGFPWLEGNGPWSPPAAAGSTDWNRP